MSEAKKCDRCKIFYEEYLGEYRFFIFKEIENNDDGKRTDLCPNCQIILEKFMTMVDTVLIDENIYVKSPIESILPELQKLEVMRKNEILLHAIKDVPGIHAIVTGHDKKVIKRDGSNISKRMKDFTALASKIFDKNKETWHEARKRAKVIIDKGEYDLYMNPPKSKTYHKLLTAKNNPEYAEKLKKDNSYMNKVIHGDEKETELKHVCAICIINPVEKKEDICNECDKDIKHFSGNSR
jgi:hypothetical protein